MQIPVDHENVFVVCDIGVHVDFFIHDNFFSP